VVSNSLRYVYMYKRLSFFVFLNIVTDFEFTSVSFCLCMRLDEMEIPSDPLQSNDATIHGQRLSLSRIIVTGSRSNATNFAL